jgi:hypothetical protein
MLLPYPRASKSPVIFLLETLAKIPLAIVAKRANCRWTRPDEEGCECEEYDGSPYERRCH